MFEKKFRVRICHYARDYYTVEYSYNRFIPWYNSIMYWFDCGMTGGLECWSLGLFKIDKAEEFASNLKSIEDVNEYHRKENIKRTEFYKKKNKFQKNNIPYKSKQIL
jgi:hypothetical protein